MKFITLVPLAALASAFVVPDDGLTNQILSNTQERAKEWLDKLPGADEMASLVRESYETGVAFSENAIDNAIVAGLHAEKAIATHMCPHSWTAFDVQSWLDSASNPLEGEIDWSEKPDHPHRPPHKKPHKKPHHRRPHGSPNLTVYELIAKSKYTTKLASLINEYDDLVSLLNSTAANFTIFAPTDKAFEKLPEHKKPSKELIRKVLLYHVSAEFYPARRVLASHTIPTALEAKGLGGDHQRLHVSLGLKGLSINHFSKVVAVNIFGSNGVIHGIDFPLIPPPSALKIISLFPSEFSTLQLALSKTGLVDDLSKETWTGGTYFAPTNLAFRKLGLKANAFLFSPAGTKYLKALLKYHVVANQTLYSDAFYGAKSTAAADDTDHDNHDADKEDAPPPRGIFHVDLPTLLGDRSLSIDVGRYGRLINIRINGYTDVAVMDGIAGDGVIQIPRSILIPPKIPKGEQYKGEEIEVQDLKDRLEVLVGGVEEL